MAKIGSASYRESDTFILFVRFAVPVSKIKACDIQEIMRMNIHTKIIMSICSALIILATLISGTAVWKINQTKELVGQIESVKQHESIRSVATHIPT